MKKIETLAEYMQLASRTCVDLGSPKANAFHMNSGIVTEVGEAIDPIKKHFAYNKSLDIINIGEEVADAMWYIANRARMFLSSEHLTKFWSTNETFVFAIGDFKKEFGSELAEATDEKQKLILTSNFLHSLVVSIPDLETTTEIDCYGIGDAVMLSVVCELVGLDFWGCLTANIEKLQIRYPEKFTEEAAINRNLDAEREVLEKTDISESELANKDLKNELGS